MKRLITTMIVLGASLVLFGFMTSCGKSDKEAVVGKYVSQKNPNEYMEIKKGGKLFVKEEVGGYAGRWKIEGDEIVFYDLPLGLVVKGKVKGNRINDNMGITWMRTSRDVSGKGDKETLIGKYVYQKDPEVYMEIKKGGTLHVKEKNHAMKYDAKWKIEGDEVIFYDLGGDLVVRGRVKGNRIKDSEGNTWVRTSKDVANVRQRQKPDEKASHYKELEETGKRIRQDKEMEEVGRRVRESMGK